MTNRKQCTRRARKTNIEKCYGLLKGGRWHTTAQLRRRVGDDFGVAIHALRHRYGLRVDRKPNPRRRRHNLYRLIDRS